MHCNWHKGNQNMLSLCTLSNNMTSSLNFLFPSKVSQNWTLRANWILIIKSQNIETSSMCVGLLTSFISNTIMWQKESCPADNRPWCQLWFVFDTHLTIKRNFSTIEGHQQMVDNHWYIISCQQQHKHNLQNKTKFSLADLF